MSRTLYDTTNKEIISDLITDQDDLINELYFIIDRQDAILINLMTISRELQSLATSRVKATHIKHAINFTSSELREEPT